MRFHHKVVVITGGSSGIGAACVRVFAREGAKVVFCAPGENDGASLLAEINAQNNPHPVCYIRCDVTKEDEIQNLMRKTVGLHDRIDCLVNNAGWHPDHRPIDGFSAVEFRSLLDLNVIGCFLAAKVMLTPLLVLQLLLQYALPHLREAKGSIVNISSMVNVLGQLEAVTYVASKGAVSAMTRALAIDEARHGVRVNTISPGNIWTPLWESNAGSLEDRDTSIRQGAEAQVMARFGHPEEVAEACLFLAADATYCTGVDLPLTGGSELAYGKKATIPATIPTSKAK